MKIRNVAFFIILIFCYQCNEPEVNPREDLTIVLNMSQKDAFNEVLARNLAKSIGTEQVIESITRLVGQRFDGDYDMLIAPHLNRPIQTKLLDNGRQQYVTLGELLTGKDNSSKAGKSVQNLADSILAHYPLLQIAIPQYEEMDELLANGSPLVTFIPENRDVETINAFDAEGNIVKISTEEPPNTLVFVLSDNERVTAIKKKTNSNGRDILAIDGCYERLSPVVETEDYYYVDNIELSEAYNKCNGGTTTGGRTGGTTGTSSTCNRDGNDDTDYLRAAKFTTMNYLRDAESWLHGNMEIFVVVNFAANNSAGFQTLKKWIPSRDRSQWKDCGIFKCNPEWHDFNLPTLVWDKEDFGDRMIYDFWEYDADTDKNEITITFTTTFENGDKLTGTNKYTVTKKDFNMGQSFVYYCDKTSDGGKVYTTGVLDFALAQ